MSEAKEESGWLAEIESLPAMLRDVTGRGWWVWPCCLYETLSDAMGEVEDHSEERERAFSEHLASYRTPLPPPWPPAPPPPWHTPRCTGAE